MSKVENLLEQIRDLVAGINDLPDKDRTGVVYQLEDELKNLRVRENDSIDGFIYVTRDLTQFKPITGNRIINENSAYIKKLAESIRMHGIKTPILVNENFGLADGQRRLAAIRTEGLNTPVPYIRRVGANIEIVGEINQLQIKWNYRDWLNRWEKADLESYKEYKDTWSKYEPYMKSRSLRGLLMLNRVDALPSEVWEKGLFNIDKSHTESNKKFLEFLIKVYVIGDRSNVFAADRNFQKALHELWKKTPNLDTERLRVKLMTHFNMINIRTDYKTYKKIVGDIYNKRLSSDKHHMITQDADEDTEKKGGMLKFGA